MAELLVEADPKAVPPSHYLKLFRWYLEERELGQVIDLVARPRDTRDRHHSVVIRSSRLIDFDAALAFSVIHYPQLLLPLFDEALIALQEALFSHPSFLSEHSNGCVKSLCHIRIAELPPMQELIKSSIGDINVESGKRLLQVSGTIVRTGGVRMLELAKQYECQNPKCRYRFTVYADPEQDNMLPQPRHCPRPNGEDGKKCSSTSIREVEDARMCVDYQEVKLQDHIEGLALGSLPRSIILILQADLVDKFHPGDDVVIVGRILRQWRPISRGARASLQIALLVNHIELLNKPEEPVAKSLLMQSSLQAMLSSFQSYWTEARARGLEWEARDQIVRAVCPQLCGMFLVKLCLLLSLIGGAPTQAVGGVKRRSEVHMLMVGDPGCGKSQLLRFASSILPRSVLTTGVGTTGAGLTCSAIKDPGGDWVLEAGAMVLANGGVCCIDEFSSIKEGDKAAIHEAMEQQTVSVAKAGLVMKLSTKTTVIACCNPKGQYELTADITTNTAIASPLLSRFDIVLVLLDQHDVEWDKTVSTFLLKQALAPETAGSSGAALPSVAAHTGHKQVEMDLQHPLIWSKDVLGQYIMCVRAHLTSLKLSAEARVLLTRYYHHQRQSEDRWNARTTVRLLESLLRLAEAHARLMFREDVLMEDAIVAILCISQAQSIGTLSAKMNDAVREDFAVNPQQQHRAHEEAVMKMLHYSRERLTQDSQSAYSGGEREPEVAQILTADIQARRDRFRKGVLERVEAMQAANKRARPSEAAGRDEPDRVSAQVPTPSLPSRSMIRNTSLQPSRYEEASSSSTVSMSMPVPAQSPLSGGNYDEHGVWASRSAEVAVHPQAAPTVIRSGSQIEQSVLSSSQNSSQTSIAASAGSSKPKRGIWGSASTTLALFGNDMEESL